MSPPPQAGSPLAKSVALTRKSAAFLRKNSRILVEDPRFFVMQSVARFELVREWMTRPQVPWDASKQAIPPNAVSSESNVTAVVSTLHNEGYYVGLTLSPALRELLVHTAVQSSCYADRDRALKLRIDEQQAMEQRLGRKIKVASYLDQQESWPAFQAIKSDRWLNAIARGYLGRDPVYLRSELAWSFPYEATLSERRSTAQVLHCDINDYKTLKFFFYLTDVGPENGPHAYIKKNPRPRTLVHQLLGQRCASIPEDVLVATYGADQLVTVTGPAGLGFVGDPYYFHRGTTPREGCRLLLQLEFGCCAYKTWYFEL